MITQSGAAFADAMRLCRSLRLEGDARKAQEICLNWVGRVSAPFEVAQLGIDMNYLGMYEQSEKLLSSVQDCFYPDVNRHLLLNELVMSRYAQGKHHLAHPLYRTLRGADEKHNLLSLLYPTASEGFAKLFMSRFLDHDESVEDKKIVVLLEGGAGDGFMHSRYVNQLVEEGARSVIVEVADGAQRCFDFPENVSLLGDLSRMYDADALTTNFCLYARYGTHPYFPRSHPSALTRSRFEHVPEFMRGYLEEGRALRGRIGLVWRSGSGARHEPYRSAPLEAFIPLLEELDCSFCSLQTGVLDAGERELLQRYGVVDFGGYLSDFEVTGCLLHSLDAVITVDTATAHLAGSIGCRAFILLARACDSRWYDCTRYTPWYECVRLYRQSELGCWKDPVSDLASDLQKLI